MNKLIIFTVVLAVSCAAFGEVWQMTAGTATIDADLSDWAGASWIPMDITAYGDPANISNAQMAVRWDTNNIYLAVTYQDSDLQLSQSCLGWNGQDDIEVYINANNDNTYNYSSSGFITAQQYLFGPYGNNASGLSSTPAVPANTWGSLSDSIPLTTAQMGNNVATSVSGNTVTYEMKVPAYNDLGTGALETLSVGDIVGFDVVAADKGASNYGWKGINSLSGKSGDAGQFQDWVLVNESLSVKYTFEETSPGTWNVFADVTGDTTAGLSAYEIWVDGVDAGTVSYAENTLGSSTEGFLASTLLQGDIAGSFNAGNYQNANSAIEGIGKVAVNESGVVLDAHALLGVLTTETGLTEENFRVGVFGLLNAAGDGYVYSPESLVTPTVEVIPIPLPIIGDANHDGVVSAGDYACVQANFGSVGTGILGDANQDGVVSAGDYACVQANFGNTSAGVVPEPASLSLLVLGCSALLKRNRKTA